jgi:choline-glycine betaine transporter
VIVMIFSTLSALSSVGKGIKCLSNINMGLSLFILAFFLVFGLTMFSFRALFLGMWDYVIALPAMSLTVFSGDGIEDSVATKLAGWQGG